MPKPKQLRGLSTYAAAIKNVGTFRVTHPLPQAVADVRAIGFDETPKQGDSVLPPPNGSVARFNSNGKVLIRKDLPKVPESYMTYRTWKDWHGQEHSGTQIRTMQIYQRELVAPPEEYLTVINGPNGALVCSRELSAVKNSESEIVHVLNLFLELFGTLDIVNLNLEKAIKVHRLNWKILPQGAYPFARARTALAEFFKGLPENAVPVIEERIKSITQYNPDFLAVGLGGFKDYVVFGFTKTGKYIFESPVQGNATYVFKDDWEQLTLLTKKQILDGSLHDSRLIHNHQWRGTLRKAILGK